MIQVGNPKPLSVTFTTLSHFHPLFTTTQIIRVSINSIEYQNVTIYGFFSFKQNFSVSIFTHERAFYPHTYPQAYFGIRIFGYPTKL